MMVKAIVELGADRALVASLPEPVPVSAHSGDAHGYFNLSIGWMLAAYTAGMLTVIAIIWKGWL